jgi:hypothetical protein
MWLAYAAGVLTPVVAVGIWLILGTILATNHGLECVAGDLTIPTREKTRLQLWFIWRWHRATAYRKQWHREAVSAYMTKWGR